MASKKTRVAPIPVVEHGIGEAVYTYAYGRVYLPMMTCLCGWSSDAEPSWEAAGIALDQHLADAAEEGSTK